VLFASQTMCMIGEIKYNQSRGPYWCQILVLITYFILLKAIFGEFWLTRFLVKWAILTVTKLFFAIIPHWQVSAFYIKTYFRTQYNKLLLTFIFLYHTTLLKAKTSFNELHNDMLLLHIIFAHSVSSTK